MSLNKTNQTSFYSLGIEIHYNIRLFINIFGIISNIISFLIFIRPNLNKKTNTGFLYSILSVLSIITFIDNAYKTFSSKYKVLTLILPSSLKPFISASLLDSLIWIQILISFDRFIVVVFPAKSKIMTKKVFILFSNDHKITILNIYILF